MDRPGSEGPPVSPEEEIPQADELTDEELSEALELRLEVYEYEHTRARTARRYEYMRRAGPIFAIAVAAGYAVACGVLGHIPICPR
jgi:hypothetical protein